MAGFVETTTSGGEDGPLSSEPPQPARPAPSARARILGNHLVRVKLLIVIPYSFDAFESARHSQPADINGAQLIQYHQLGSRTFDVSTTNDVPELELAVIFGGIGSPVYPACAEATMEDRAWRLALTRIGQRCTNWSAKYECRGGARLRIEVGSSSRCGGIVGRRRGLRGRRCNRSRQRTSVTDALAIARLKSQCDFKALHSGN